MLTPPPLLTLLSRPESELEWVSLDSSNTRSGLAYWRGIVCPQLLGVAAVPRPAPADFRADWWRAFGFAGRASLASQPPRWFAGLAMEIHDSAEPWARMPLAWHRGRVTERWHDVQGTERAMLECNSSEWRRVARETLAYGDRPAARWSWPADRDAIKPISVALANQHWGLGLTGEQDDEAEAVLVGHWVATTSALELELGKMRRRIEEEQAKEARRIERERRAEAKAVEDAQRAARVAARNAARQAAAGSRA